MWKGCEAAPQGLRPPGCHRPPPSPHRALRALRGSGDGPLFWGVTRRRRRSKSLSSSTRDLQGSGESDAAFTSDLSPQHMDLSQVRENTRQTQTASFLLGAKSFWCWGEGGLAPSLGGGTSAVMCWALVGCAPHADSPEPRVRTRMCPVFLLRILFHALTA